MADEETDLIHRASEGDHRAFGLLVRRYDARILRLTCEVAGNEEDGRDICQEVLVAAYITRGRYDRAAVILAELPAAQSGDNVNE